MREPIGIIATEDSEEDVDADADVQKMDHGYHRLDSGAAAEIAAAMQPVQLSHRVILS